MKYTAVCPYIWQPFKDEFEKTCKLDVLYINNTGKTNTGCSGGWNKGVERMRQDNSDWLILCSAAIRFGENGGLDFIEQLDDQFINISATDKNMWEREKQVGIFGWHLIAFSKECIEKVGKWDDNFWPYGWDDIDYSIRMQKAFPDPEYSRRTKKVPVDVTDTIMAHSIHLAGVNPNNQELMTYLTQKWNYQIGCENPIETMYDHPFNDKNKSSKWWPTTERDKCR